MIDDHNFKVLSDFVKLFLSEQQLIYDHVRQKKKKQQIFTHKKLPGTTECLAFFP